MPTRSKATPAATKAPADPTAVAPLSESLRRLARRGELRRLRKGVQLIVEGDRGDTIYIVLAGMLRAYGASADGRELTYGLYGAGEYVGELGLDGGPRSANVETVEPTLVSVVVRATLEQHLREEPDFAFELLAKVIRLTRNVTLGMKQIALNDVYGRLKARLEQQAVAAADGTRLIEPAPTHKALSQQLGCSREMISRVAKDLERGGYIEARRGRIVLLRELPAKW